LWFCSTLFLPLNFKQAVNNKKIIVGYSNLDKMMVYLEFGRSVVYKELDVWMIDTVDALDDFS